MKWFSIHWSFTIYSFSFDWRHPTWPKHLIRLAVGALTVYRMRLIDMFVREHVHLLWIIEGEDHLRVHNGICYFYNEQGALLPTRASLLNQHLAGSRTPVRSLGATDRNGLNVGSMFVAVSASFNLRVRLIRMLTFSFPFWNMAILLIHIVSEQ